MNSMSPLRFDLKTVAAALGGKVSGKWVKAPGPGHSRNDDSLSVAIGPRFPNGFWVVSHANDDPLECRDFVSRKLGLPEWTPGRQATSHEAIVRMQARAMQGLGETQPEPKERKPFSDRWLIAQGYAQTAVYPYYSAGGEMLFEVLRYEHPSEPKKILPRHMHEGTWFWGSGTDERPLYRAGDMLKVAHSTVFVCEGEKDADRLASLGFVAVTVPFHKWSPEAVEALLDKDCMILADKDTSGEKNALHAAEALYGVASSVRIVNLPGLESGGDVSDWLDAGNDHRRLVSIAEEAPLWRPDAPTPTPADGEGRTIAATPFRWVDPAAIPMRRFIYGGHYIRQFLSCDIAPGGVGKSSLGIAELIAIATGKPLLGVTPKERGRVWYFNGEDPLEELERRVMATVTHYRVTRDDIEGWFFLDTGRRMPIVIAEQTRDGTTISKPVVDAVIATINENKIDVLTIDPFVSSHRVTENDNPAIERVAKQWAQIADQTGCAVNLVHHARKTNGAEVTVEDGRGAVALLAAARSARALNQMTEEEAAKAGVENRRLHFRVTNGKANLSPPADQAEWFKLASVDLGNGPVPGAPGDSVGVVTKWEWPDPFADITTADLRAAQNAVATGGPWRENNQAKDWVGIPIASALKLDPDNKAHKKKISSLLSVWMSKGMFARVVGKDSKRMERTFVEVGQWASD